MRAVVTKPFPGVCDGEIMTRMIACGETIVGDLARVAIENGWAVPEKEEEPADPEPDLEKLTIAELQALATDRGIDLAGATKKADILAVLTAAASV